MMNQIINNLCSYVELETTSNFSFLQGASFPEELIQQAALLEYEALALTDNGTLAGVVRAHTATKDYNLRLIIGSRVKLYDDRSRLPLSLLLYPTSRSGYANLSELLSLGKSRSTKGSYLLQVRDLSLFASNLIAILVIHDFNDSRLHSTIKAVIDIYSNKSCYLKLTCNYDTHEHSNISQLLKLTKIFDLPLVATNNVYYHDPQRRPLQDVISCIRQQCTIETAGFNLFANSERFLKPPKEMVRLYRDFPQAITSTLKISEATSGFSLDQLKYQYPHEICPDNLSPREYLTKLVWEQAAARYPLEIPPKVKSQLEHELIILADLDYEKYFLTVYDIVQFAKSQNILCQGRGAAANSVVCYILGITAVDPEKINLLFERFVSKERNEPPDIDIDFEHERREEVIQYIYNKYGRNRAALAAAVITYRSRSAFRDVGKVFGLSPQTIATLLKAKRQFSDYLEEMAAKNKPAQLDLKHFLSINNLNPENQNLLNTVKLANELKGFPRHLSQHVGGFIISEDSLSSIVPIENAAMPDRSVIEWDKDDIDAMGMLKIDILALGMLTCIRKALEMINSPTYNKELPKWSSRELLLHNIPPEDPKVYEMLSNADAIGVFQVESRAQMSMLPRLRPRCFYDLVVEVAIVRPGPLQGGIVHPYLRRRNGTEPVTYPSTAIKSFLESTLGVPIFQEQIMELSIIGAGFTPGEADRLRRALGSWKRNKNIIQQFGQKLVSGLKKNGYSQQFIKQTLQQIKGFAEYGFPQSHAASFALLVYVSAWLKYYHPAVFAAALLNSQPMGFYMPAQIIEDTKRHEIKVLPVDVLFSSWDSTLEGNALRLGMRLVKGLGRKEAKKIIATTKNPPRPSSILALWRNSEVSVHALKALARADAFRSFGKDRQQALWEIQRFKDEKLPLFQKIEVVEEAIDLPTIAESLHVSLDYKTTGFSLKAHPLSFLRSGLDKHRAVKLSDLSSKNLCHNDSIIIAGLVIVRQQPNTANGIVFMTVEDESGIGNLVIKFETFQRLKTLLIESSILLCRGRLQRLDKTTSILVHDAISLDYAFHDLTGASRDFY